MGRIQNLILNHWFVLHLVFIAFYALFIIFKILFSEGVNPLSSKPDNYFKFDPVFFTLILAGFFLLGIPIILRNLKGHWIIIIAFLSFVSISLGYFGTKDKFLKWEGSDVPLGNYNAAMEFSEHGVLKGIKNWNDRTNPYAIESEYSVYDSVKSFLSRKHLDWITFNKWEENNLPEGYDITNNRPLMHPPLAPAVLSVWMSFFPFGHWSSVLFMILLEFTSIILVVLLSGSRIKDFKIKQTILFIFLTAPVFIFFNNPSTEQLSMLLFLVSTYIILDENKHLKPYKYFISGVLIGLTFYTKFNIVFYIIFQLLFFIFGSNDDKWRKFIAYLSGIIVIIALFNSLGYYFWLTFITGYFVKNTYAAHHPVSFIYGFSKILYFGPSVILLTLLLCLNIGNCLNKKILLPVLISLIFTMIFLWDQGTWNRYLVFYLPVLGLFFVNFKFLRILKTRDIIIIPVSNFVFIILNTYF